MPHSNLTTCSTIANAAITQSSVHRTSTQQIFSNGQTNGKRAKWIFSQTATSRNIWGGERIWFIAYGHKALCQLWMVGPQSKNKKWVQHLRLFPQCPFPKAMMFGNCTEDFTLSGPRLKSLAFSPFPIYYIGSTRTQDELHQTQGFALHRGLHWHTGYSERRSAMVHFQRKWLRMEHGKISPLHGL